MTKLHEETWSANEVAGDHIEIVVAETGERMAITFHDPDRARLAAQAPAMARLLFAIEWAGQNQYGQRQCPSCHGDEWEEDEPRTGHMEDCELATVLRAAGVLP